MAEICSAPRDIRISLLILAAAMAFGLICSISASKAIDLEGGDGLEELYKIVVDLPAEMVRNVEVSLTLPSGLIYEDEGLAISGSVTTALVDVRGSNDGTGEVGLTWNFGDVDNFLDQDILIGFKVVVADVSSNQNDANLGPGRAALDFEDAEGAHQSADVESYPVVIVEPDLTAEKSATASIGDDGNARLAYVIKLRHFNNSRSGAFDVEVSDSLPPGLALSPGSAGIVTGPQGGEVEVLGSSDLRWRFDEIDLFWTESQEVVLGYEAVVEDGSTSNSYLAGQDDDDSGATGRLDWTSSPGVNPEERSYSRLYDEVLSELSVSIDSAPDYPEVGETVTYTYTIRNTGEDDIFGISLVAGRPGDMRQMALEKEILSPGEKVAALARHEITDADLPGPLENAALALGKDHLGNPVVGIGKISTDLPASLEVNKTAEKRTVRPGGLLNYTISLCNRGTVTVENVLVKDVFDRGVEFVSASPAPVQDGNIWRFDSIGSGECKNITLTIGVPRQDFEFRMDQRVRGEGFVNVANDYDTAPPSCILTNCVYVNFTVQGVTKTISDCEKVTVGEPGTELSTREHGSGRYENEERMKMSTESRSLEMENNVTTAYATITLDLYRSRTVTYNSRWTESAEARNKVTGASMTESYRHASSIDRESRMKLDENESVMEVDSQFDGMGHLGFLKLPVNANPKSTPIFESREDYAGSFRVLEKVDEYGSSATSEKVTSGFGLVAVDKRIGDSQRSYESGTGSYKSGEIIETNTNYIAKDIGLLYAPVNLSLAGGASIDQKMMWKEGIWSKTPGTSFIGEEYTGAIRLDKETVAKGLNEMDTVANFSGKARYRAVLNGEIDLYDKYEGNYSVHRKALFEGVPKYDRPHLNVITEGSFYEETVIENHQHRTITIATYTITLENDGNATLGPIYVTDFFPPGARFINASTKPSELGENRADWVFTHLAIGDRLAIALNLDVTEYRGDELVNRVEACGIHGDEQICAVDFAALEIEWLKCCSNDTVSVSKTAWIDEIRPNVVWYRIEIENSAETTRVATVTDSLPDGMFLMETTVPFSSYENCVVTWNTIDLGPMEKKTIDYSVEALRGGRFENQVRVKPRSVDGAATSPAYATAVIDIAEFDDEMSSPGWQPPDWDFSNAERSTRFEMCEEVFS